MFEISVKTGFSAAHHLAGYPGACARVHGHNWEVEIFFRGARLNRLGILHDFRAIKKVVRELLTALDHADLNRHPAFKRANPTSENIARHLFRTMERRFNTRQCRVARVTVSEGPGTSASYWNHGKR